jgi:hypothetical protein
MAALAPRVIPFTKLVQTFDELEYSESLGSTENTYPMKLTKSHSFPELNVDEIPCKTPIRSAQKNKTPLPQINLPSNSSKTDIKSLALSPRNILGEVTNQTPQTTAPSTPKSSAKRKLANRLSGDKQKQKSITSKKLWTATYLGYENDDYIPPPQYNIKIVSRTYRPGGKDKDFVYQIQVDKYWPEEFYNDLAARLSRTEAEIGARNTEVKENEEIRQNPRENRNLDKAKRGRSKENGHENKSKNREGLMMRSISKDALKRISREPSREAIKKITRESSIDLRPSVDVPTSYPSNREDRKEINFVVGRSYSSKGAVLLKRISRDSLPSFKKDTIVHSEEGKKAKSTSSTPQSDLNQIKSKVQSLMEEKKPADKCTIYRAFYQFSILREKLKRKGLIDKTLDESFRDSGDDLQLWLDCVMKNEYARKDKDLFLFLEPTQIGDEKNGRLKKAVLYFS